MDSIMASHNDKKSESPSVELGESAENQDNIETSLNSTEKKSSSQKQKITWNFSIFDQKRIAFIFKKLSYNHDGLVSFSSVESYLSKRSYLNDNFDFVWNLCDPDRSGKVASDQFTVIMWLVEQSKNGTEIPVSLCELGMPERFADALTTSYHNDASEATKIKASNRDELLPGNFQYSEEVLSITLQDKEKLDDPLNFQEEKDNTLLQSHQDRLPIEYSVDCKSKASNALLNPNQNESLSENSQEATSKANQYDLQLGNFVISKDEATNAHMKLHQDDLTSKELLKFQEIHETSKTKLLSVIDQVKHFQHLAEEFQTTVYVHEQNILEEQARNNQNFLNLRNFRKQIFTLQEKCADSVREIQKIIFELNDNNGLPVKGFSGGNFETKDSFEMASQHSKSTSYLFALSNDTIKSSELNQLSVSQSTNPFRKDTKLSPTIYETVIEADTLSTPLLSSSDFNKSLGTSTGEYENTAAFNSDQFSSSLSEIEALMSSLSIQSVGDTVKKCNSPLSDSSTNSFSSKY